MKANFALPKGSQVYADATYNNYLVEDMLAQESIYLQVQWKPNSKRPVGYYYLNKLAPYFFTDSLSLFESTPSSPTTKRSSKVKSLNRITEVPGNPAALMPSMVTSYLHLLCLALVIMARIQ